MNKTENAISLFNAGFNCSQVVFSAFSEELGLSREIALKVSCGFGGGMRQGEVCGAVTGAIMVLSLKYGQNETNDVESKQKTYGLVRRFSDEFKNINGSIICRELLKCDLSYEDGMKYAKENNLFKCICPKMIEAAIDILEKTIQIQ